MLRGWAIGQLHGVAEAVEPIQKALSIWIARGRQMELPALYALLAETYEKIGDVTTARQAVADGLAVAKLTGEGYYHSELYRLQGRYLLKVGQVEAAQASFEQALATARAQGARSLELRAAMDLSLMWRKQGRRAEAYGLLNGIYSWFTEGHETYDLLRAQELCRALAP
jgi:predicted ATPase